MPTILIVGCGFLGETAADLFFEHGWQVTGVTAKEESASRLAGKPYPVVVADVADAMGVRALSQGRQIDWVVHCASSSRGDAGVYRRVYVDGMRAIREALPTARVIFTSSTSVYGQTDGSEVAEDSPTEPERETARRLLAAEKVALEERGFVLRLAGLYGPGRSVLMTRFLNGEMVLEGGGGRWINQIHRDDAARAVVHVAMTGPPPGIYNVVDNQPATQREVCEWLGEYFDRPMPPVGPINPLRKRAWTSKRVSNARLRATGWSPGFESFREAIPSIAASLGFTR